VPTHEGTCWSSESGACAALKAFQAPSVYISLGVSRPGMERVGALSKPIPMPIPDLAVPITYPFVLIFNTHTHGRWGWILRVLSEYGFFFQALLWTL